MASPTVRLTAAILVTATLAGPLGAEERAVETWALLINGGGSPPANVPSHLRHLQDMADNLERRGIPRERISVFCSDGEDPGQDLALPAAAEESRWLIEGTDLAEPLLQPELADTAWDGVELRPATVAELRRWFVRMRETIGAEDTLLVFVTDHGAPDPDDPENGFLSLWHESLSVLEYRALVAHLPPGTRVVAVMSQCYSGGFAAAMSPLHGSTPGGSVCGFFSTTASRPAYGCYPEGRDQDRLGHASRFIDAMSRNGSLEAAHREVLLADATPDVPLRSSDVYLEQLLRDRAALAGKGLEEIADELLGKAWEDPRRPEPETGLLGRIASAFDLAAPRSLRELEERIDQLGALSNGLSICTDGLRRELDGLRRDNLDAFREAEPAWSRRTAPAEVAALDASGRARLAAEALPALEGFVRSRDGAWELLDELRGLHGDALETAYRVEIRLAALLRMRAILVRVAGIVLLERDGLGEAAAAFAALERCERSPVGELSGGEAGGPPAGFAFLPPMAQELATVERICGSAARSSRRIRNR
jgi:hypothetical protein